MHINDQEEVFSPEEAFSRALKQPFGELNSRPSPIPEHPIICGKEFDKETKKKHADHMLAAHHKFMANHYRKKGHKK